VRAIVSGRAFFAVLRIFLLEGSEREFSPPALG
jgi:hypothetical protein